MDQSGDDTGPRSKFFTIPSTRRSCGSRRGGGSFGPPMGPRLRFGKNRSDPPGRGETRIGRGPRPGESLGWDKLRRGGGNILAAAG